MKPTAVAALCAALSGLTAGTAHARPDVHRVVNVDQTDVLNIRETPSPTSAIVATLSPNARMVEVLETRHGWGRVVVRGGEGWVSLAYLAAMDRTPIPGQGAPGGFRCAGTEPFWGLDIGTDGTGRYHDMMSLGEERAIAVSESRTASGRFQPFVYRFGGEAGGVAVVTEGMCSDGMSDRQYGWRAYVDAEDGEGVRFVEGCCWTPPQE
ncbi:SH3 domain-containing protein [Maricaulis sp.]|jgi:uncharacterized membrane protein|uniref:COG3650 family protein n=1 Tax=Maricaulis sp. TaxID=1486257 RepID=UPI0026138242|nr:SH3 domain-containing protein [Maricaulis sp.]